MKITLCGSAKFEALFREWDEALTLCGHTVYNLAVYPSEKGGKDWHNDDVKNMLDAAAMAKIANSDAIVVLNSGQYIGESTRRELYFAVAMGKQIYMLQHQRNWTGPLAENLIHQIVGTFPS